MAKEDSAKSLDNALAKVNSGRRGFLKGMLLGGAALAALPLVTSTAALGVCGVLGATENEQVTRSQRLVVSATPPASTIRRRARQAIANQIEYDKLGSNQGAKSWRAARVASRIFAK